MPSASGEFLRQVAFFISYNGCLPGIDLYLKLIRGGCRRVMQPDVTKYVIKCHVRLVETDAIRLYNIHINHI